MLGGSSGGAAGESPPRGRFVQGAGEGMGGGAIFCAVRRKNGGISNHILPVFCCPTRLKLLISLVRQSAAKGRPAEDRENAIKISPFLRIPLQNIAPPSIPPADPGTDPAEDSLWRRRPT